MREPITTEQVNRFRNAMEDAALAGAAALRQWGTSKQWDMAVEEVGELLTAMARKGRGRASDADVVSECADVMIMAIQVAGIHSGGSIDMLIDALSGKAARLRDRVEAAKRKEAP